MYLFIDVSRIDPSYQDVAEFSEATIFCWSNVKPIWFFKPLGENKTNHTTYLTSWSSDPKKYRFNVVEGKHTLTVSMVEMSDCGEYECHGKYHDGSRFVSISTLCVTSK